MPEGWVGLGGEGKVITGQGQSQCSVIGKSGANRTVRRGRWEQPPGGPLPASFSTPLDHLRSGETVGETEQGCVGGGRGEQKQRKQGTQPGTQSIVELDLIRTAPAGSDLGSPNGRPYRI